MAKNCVTIIDMTDAYIRCLQTKIAGGKGSLVGFEVRPLHQHTDDELVRVIRDLTRGKSVESERLVFSVPRRLTIVKRMRLPAIQDQELRKMIGLQLVNQTPYHVDEVMFDYQVVNKTQDGYTEVLVVIVNCQVSGRYLQILKRAGLSSARMTLSSMGLAQWWHRQSANDKAMAQVPVALINIDATHSEIAFCQAKKLLFSRSINYGERDLTEQGVEAIVRQVDLSLLTYRNENMGSDIHKILVICGLSQLELLRQQLEKSVGVSTRVCQPLDGWAPSKKFQALVGSGIDGRNATVAYGLSAMDLKRGLNLTPPEVHEGKQQVRRRWEWVSFVILFILAFTLGAAVFGVELIVKEQQFAQIQQQGKGFGPALKKAQARGDFITAFEAKLAQRVRVSLLMDALFAVTPEDLSYRSITLDERAQMTLQGYAQTSNSVNLLQQALLKSPHFSDVTLEFATKRRIYNMELTDFKIGLKAVTGGQP